MVSLAEPFLLTGGLCLKDKAVGMYFQSNLLGGKSFVYMEVGKVFFHMGENSQYLRIKC